MRAQLATKLPTGEGNLSGHSNVGPVASSPYRHGHQQCRIDVDLPKRRAVLHKPSPDVPIPTPPLPTAWRVSLWEHGREPDFSCRLPQSVDHTAGLIKAVKTCHDSLHSCQDTSTKQAVLERLWKRNSIRRQLRLPPLDIPKLYWRTTRRVR